MFRCGRHIEACNRDSDLGSGRLRIIGLQVFARRCSVPDQVRRLPALALIVDGGGRSDAVKFAGVTLQIVRDWMLRFNEGGPDALATRKAPGRASILHGEQRARLLDLLKFGLLVTRQDFDRL